MRKFLIVLIVGVFIILLLGIWFIPHGFEVSEMKTTDRITLVLQVLAAFVTAAVSVWGLIIANRQIKHWEIARCDKLWEEYCILVDERNAFAKQSNADKNSYDKEMDETFMRQIFNFWEKISILEKKSYLDAEILCNSFYLSLFSDLECGVFDNFLKERYKENKHALCHTRTLYIKWKEKYKEENQECLKSSWNKMWALIKKARDEKSKNKNQQ